MTDSDTVRLTRSEQLTITAAANAYRSADGSLWDFAEIAADVVGMRDGLTAILAERIKRSPDAVEGFAAAWTLWSDLIGPYNSHAEDWRDVLYVSHFVSVGRKYKAEWISLADAADYLQRAMAEDWTVEALRSKLPHEDRGDFRADAKRLIKTLERKFINAPALNVSGKKYSKVRRAALLLKGRLEEVE